MFFFLQEETVKKQTTELRLIQERVIKLETNNTKLHMEKEVLEVRYYTRGCEAQCSCELVSHTNDL